MSKLERFKKYLNDTYPHPIDEYREAALWHLWQAALSTRKVYGYGVISKTGPQRLVYETKLSVELESTYLNKHDLASAPYRPVELFYEDSES